MTHIALAMDATSIGDRFVVWSINILLAGCGIPVAWHIVKGNEPGSWRPHWQLLIEKLRDAIPKNFVVILTADWGLYADWLAIPHEVLFLPTLLNTFTALIPLRFITNLHLLVPYFPLPLHPGSEERGKTGVGERFSPLTFVLCYLIKKFITCSGNIPRLGENSDWG